MVALQEVNFRPSRSEGHKVVAMPIGHKVVAMPTSSLSMSVRDAVSSRSTFNPDRPRSLSAGRATTRSRDIVQEVYDRMGVSRGGPIEDTQANENTYSPERRGCSSAPQRRREPDSSSDKFSQRYKAAAALSTPRGRSLELAGTDGERRARSLSRGRSVAGRWPPAAPLENAPAPAKSRMIEEGTAASTTPSSPKRNARSYSHSDSQDDSVENHSPQKESLDKDTNSSIPSVKDRISVFAGPRTTARKFSQNKPANYQTYTSVERPKKIDIYAEARRQEKQVQPQDDDIAGLAPPSSTVPPSPAAAAAADVAAEMVRRNSSALSVKSSTSGRTPRANGIAGTYLGAIKLPPATITTTPTQTTSAPLSEISAMEGNGDGYSVAASSVSGDDFGVLSPTARRSEYSPGVGMSKKPSWNERNNKTHVSPTTLRSANGNYKASSTAKQPTMNSSEIEKIVEQRVQARVAVVEMRMEEQMQRLEKRLEERMKVRVDVIEEKIDKMNSMLAMLLSRELRGSEARENEI